MLRPGEPYFGELADLGIIVDRQDAGAFTERGSPLRRPGRINAIGCLGHRDAKREAHTLEGRIAWSFTDIAAMGETSP